MATALKRVRGLGSARSGTETFWRQRVTAVANIPLVIFLILAIVTHIGADYGTMRAFIARPLVALAFLALINSAAIHMRIGLKEIIEDYVHGPGIKFVMLILNILFSTTIAVTCLYAVLKISLSPQFM